MFMLWRVGLLTMIPAGFESAHGMMVKASRMATQEKNIWGGRKAPSLTTVWVAAHIVDPRPVWWRFRYLTRKVG